MNTRTLDKDSVARPNLSHIVLRTADLDEAIAWYATVLGTRVVYRGDGAAALTFDGEHHRIALIQVPVTEEDQPSSTGLEHVAFKFSGVGEWLGTFARLADEGVAPEICLHHRGTASMYFRDPDGVQVELFIDTLIADEATEYMGSDAFEQNPIGAPFDPQALVEQYEAGEPISTVIAEPAFDTAAFEQLFAVGGGMAAVADSMVDDER